MAISKEKYDPNKWEYHYDDIMKKWDNNEITEEEIRELNSRDLIDPISVHQLTFNGPLADDLLYCTFHCPISELKEKIAKIKADMQYRKVNYYLPPK